MRWFRFAIVLTISLLTVGLQAAPGPFVLCVSKCEIAETGETVELVCWSGPTQSGCQVVVAGSSTSGGCCAPKQTEQVDVSCCAPDVEAIDVADLGCCVADASCPPFESCKQFPTDSDGECPVGSPECFYCLPGRILADKAPLSDQDGGDTGRLLASLATAQLAIADYYRQNSHTHSPPGHIMAESGSTTCIENCLLLI